MTKPPKTHILEGIDSSRPARTAITACGRYVLPDAVPLIGRAHVLAGREDQDVTCALCRRVYRLPELPK